MYPVNWPLWKLVAKAGIPLRFTLIVHFDAESRTFWAESPNLSGLVVEGADLEEVRREAMLAAEMLLELQLQTSPTPRLRMRPQLDMDGLAVGA